MSNNFVAILMGSDSDLPIMQHGADILASLGISYEINVFSAHRTPEAARNYVQNAEQRGVGAFICGAGLAAHLAGFVAAHTVKPVIGVPLDSGSLKGMDSLLSTVQMPAGIPVACVAIGKPGAQNAAFLSAQILAVNDHALMLRLQQQRADNTQALLNKNAALQEKLHSQAL